jgi:hypothetical protein
MANHSHEFVIKDENNIVNTPQNPERNTVVFVKIKHMFIDVQNRKFGYLRAPLSLLSNTSRFNILEDPCKELQPSLWASHVLKSARDSFALIE